MFEWLTHAKTRQKILKMFFKDPENPLYGLKIADSLKISPGTTHRELNALCSQNVLKKSKKGALVLYQLNVSHPYFQELKRSVFHEKREERVLFMSGLKLSLRTEHHLLADFSVFLNYAKEMATEVVFLGNMLDLISDDLLPTLLFHKPLLQELLDLEKTVKVKYVSGNSDCFLSALASRNSHEFFLEEYQNSFFHILAAFAEKMEDKIPHERFSGSVSPHSEALYRTLKNLNQEGLNLYQNKLLSLSRYANSVVSRQNSKKEYALADLLLKNAKNLIHKQKFSYLVYGGLENSEWKELPGGIVFLLGDWSAGKQHFFVEIDKEGGALVNINDLK